jgi:hypothetical protein
MKARQPGWESWSRTRVSLKKGANAFDNSVPPGHNSSPSFRMKKIPVCLLVLMSKNLVRGGDFAIELS